MLILFEIVQLARWISALNPIIYNNVGAVQV